MQLTAEKLTVHNPTQSGIVLLALVLTPKGCEGGHRGRVTLYNQAFDMRSMVVVEDGEVRADTETGAVSFHLPLLLATDVDPDDWLLAHLQVWETAHPEKAHGMLAGLRGQIDRTALGRRLGLAHARWLESPVALPSLGVATVGAQEVMGLVEVMLTGCDKGGGTMIFEQVYTIGPGAVAADTVRDEKGRAEVELRWEEKHLRADQLLDEVTVFEKLDGLEKDEPDAEGLPKGTEVIEAEDDLLPPDFPPVPAFDDVYRHPKRWDEVTEGRKVSWVETGKPPGPGVLLDTNYGGVVLIEKGAIGDHAVLYCSEHDVQVEVTRLKDFKILAGDDLATDPA